MKTVRHALCTLGLVASLLAPSVVRATSFSTDQSDLWYIPSEGGWGMQLVQRGNVIFATLFVYDPSGHPIWYVATLSPTGSLIWSGNLYVTTGPWFGTVPYDPTLFSANPVGIMTWNGQFIETGTLTYSVNGVMVTKNVVRQTLVLDNYNGTYLGALYATVTGCSNPANNGTAGGSATTTVVQSGQAVSITIVGPTNSITLSGFLTQYGQFGSIQGMYNVSSGEAGNFSMYEINGQQSHWTARYALTSANTGCQSNGYVGGMRQR